MRNPVTPPAVQVVPVPTATEIEAATTFAGANGSGTATASSAPATGSTITAYSPDSGLTNGDTVSATVTADSGYEFTGGLTSANVDITVAGLA